MTAPTTTPQDFARTFAAAWVAAEAETLTRLTTPDAEMLTLTGLWCEGRAALLAAAETERMGTLARAPAWSPAAPPAACP
ncbi:MAG: hypothetical protein ACK4L4_11080 [Gemmobacter sp.]